MEQEQNPPFPSPEELKSKLTEFMKSNFGDRIAFTSVAQPDMAETGEKAQPKSSSLTFCHVTSRHIWIVS